MTLTQHLDMYYDFFFKKGEKVPREQLPQQQVNILDLKGDSRKGLKASWLGHSSLLINIDGYSILTDPVFERKVSPVGPSRFNDSLPLEIQDLPSVDVVIISHDHYDHLNTFSIRQLVDKTKVFIVPQRVGKRLAKWGVPEEKIVELNWWDETTPIGELSIAATPAQHFSGRGLFDKNSTLWASWVIRTKQHTIFFSGDTGYFDGFKEIGHKYGPFDVTFLECGAYNEHWSKVHMAPEQTVQAFLDLDGKILQPIHWATFNLALHPWYEPIERLTKEARVRGVTLSTPIMGDTVDYAQQIVAKRWWEPAMERGRKSNSHKELAASSP